MCTFNGREHALKCSLNRDVSGMKNLNTLRLDFWHNSVPWPNVTFRHEPLVVISPQSDASAARFKDCLADDSKRTRWWNVTFLEDSEVSREALLVS